MDDYRARFKSWKCPIRGELSIEAHPQSIEAIRAGIVTLKRQVDNAIQAEIARQKTDPFYAPARHILSKTLWAHGRA